MAKKKNNNNNHHNQNAPAGEVQNNNINEDNHQKEGGGAPGKPKNITVVLKTDLHCEGCANKIIKRIRSFQGVEGVKCEFESNKLSVLGNVDPYKVKEEIEKNTFKKFELISPKGNGGDNNNNKQKQKEKEEKEKEKKPKEIPVTTAVMKVQLHCEGCVNKIYKLVSKTDGYQEMKVDKMKDMITVIGAIDMKALAEKLKNKMRKNVEIVQPKKDEGKGKGDKKGGGGDGGCGGDGGGGKDKKGGGGGGGKDKKGGGGEGGGEDKAAKGGEANKMEMQQVQYGFPYTTPFVYGPGYYPGDEQFQAQNGYIGLYHAPQMFSDENPNACVVM